MNVSDLGHAFTRPIDILQLANQVPAAFSEHPSGSTSDSYVFISTKEAGQCVARCRLHRNQSAAS